jgi:LCP family protein required for cell wall assembly
MAHGGRPGRRIGWSAGIAALLVLLAGGAVATTQFVRSHYDVPQADLFGTPAPDESSTGLAAPSPSASPTPEPGAGITGPLNFLLVGIDPRESVPTWQPHADAVLVLHVNKTLDRGYLFSLPRDLLVDIPAFPKSGYGGGRTKLTHAMSYGSRRPGRARPSAAQGFQLVAQTVTRYTGISFNGGAVLNFRGFKDLVNALGGVDLYVDQRVASIHMRPDGKHRAPGWNGYVGPQMVYEPGQRHLTGWQALDYARQRYIAGGDYARQRHQQQLIKAVVQRVFAEGVATDPGRMERILRALAGTLVFDGRGKRAIDFAFALRNLRPQNLTMVALPGRSVGSGGRYRGEQLDPIARRFFAELRAGRADSFVTANYRLVVRR